MPILRKASTGQITSETFIFLYFWVDFLTASAFIRTKVCLELHVSVVSGPMPVWVMIHRLIDKTFWVSVAFGLLASAASAVGFILKVCICSHSEAFSCLAFYHLNPLEVLEI